MTSGFTMRSRDFLRPGASYAVVLIAVPKRDAERTE